MTFLFILLCGFAVMGAAVVVQWVLDRFRDAGEVLEQAPFRQSSNVAVRASKVEVR